MSDKLNPVGVTAKDAKSPGGDPRALDAPVEVPDIQALQVAGAVPGPGSDAGYASDDSPLAQRLGYHTSS